MHVLYSYQLHLLQLISDKRQAGTPAAALRAGVPSSPSSTQSGAAPGAAGSGNQALQPGSGFGSLTAPVCTLPLGKFSIHLRLSLYQRSMP